MPVEAEAVCGSRLLFGLETRLLDGHGARRIGADDRPQLEVVGSRKILSVGPQDSVNPIRPGLPHFGFQLVLGHLEAIRLVDAVDEFIESGAYNERHSDRYFRRFWIEWLVWQRRISCYGRPSVEQRRLTEIDKSRCRNRHGLQPRCRLQKLIRGNLLELVHLGPAEAEFLQQLFRHAD